MSKKLSIEKIRNEFPILNQKINDYPLIYVDNASSTQKPLCVINKLNQIYTTSYANVHRGIHTLSEISTSQLEETRKNIAKFINAKKDSSIIFTRGTTDALNKIAFGLEHLIKKDDEIILSIMEHHANLVCWQELAKRTSAKLKFIDIDENYRLNIKDLDKLLSKKTKIISLTYCSNVLGTINNIGEIFSLVKKYNSDIITVVDSAQIISHKKIDCSNLNIDFLVFSSHKLYGPTGVGILYINENFYDILQPREFGGNMINEVKLESSTYGSAPFKFEAGTPNIADIIAFNEVLTFVEEIGFDFIEKYEKDLTNYFLEKIKILGNDFILIGPKTSKDRVSVFSFKFSNIHPQDLSMLLDQYGIAIRSGHHCAIPLHEKLNLNGTSRISFGIYNTKQEIDFIVDTLIKIRNMYKTGKFLV